MNRSLLAERADFIWCRTLGHSWDQLAVDAETGSTRTRSGVWLRLRCTRCHAERLDEVGRNSGLVEYRRYIYPEGYHRSADDYAPRDDWRAAYLRIVGIVKNGSGA